MRELEKILEEINRRIDEYVEHDYVRGSGDVVKGLSIAKSIVRKHMNDGWIPVEERFRRKPYTGVQVLIRRQGEQIGDTTEYLAEKYNIRGDADGQEDS